MHTNSRLPLAHFFALVCAIVFLFASTEAAAQNSPCSTSGLFVTCSGNQTNGVVAAFPLTGGTLTVNGLTGPITLQPANGWGINVLAPAATGTVTVNAGTSFSPIVINPAFHQGIGGVGIFATGVDGAPGENACNACTGFLGLEGRSSTDGSPGSAGAPVIVNLYGTFETWGFQAPGVLINTLGGNGGKGGDSTTGRNSKAGGAGGAGGTINIGGSATITTHGDKSAGILALSEGGNGGQGGSGSTFNSAEDGRPGGPGGTVTINGNFVIETFGVDSYGIWGKAMGGVAGGGGDGGWTGTAPGSGGTGSAGGTVNISTSGTITTHNSDAFGIYAESIGGFGGGGGSGTSIFRSEGGSGASAGVGGTAIVNNNAAITTFGARAHGIFAESVGGGGGAGGSGGGAISSLGGSGSTGGNGGTVSVSNSNTITATGLGARGIYAQSIGGGGGDGGNSAGLSASGGSGSTTSDGGAVFVNNNGNILASESAIFAQSIGGGGGNGGSSSGWFSFGGSGGSGGDAGLVMLTSHGNLTTLENNANGIFAQSLGGGGGHGGNSVAVGAQGSLAIGGSGAAGGLGGNVYVGVSPATGMIDAVTGSILTFGQNSNGIMAQSVGGGGGDGGYAVSASVGFQGSASIGLGGKGGSGNDAFNSQVFFGNSASRITTYGYNSNGIFAQSVGGGGGNGGLAIAASASNGFTASIGLGGDGGPGGNGGVVTVGSSLAPILGSIYTYGDHASGVLAQSVGGGGGNGGMSIAGSAGVRGVNFSMGGKGNSGGDASAVFLTNGALVQTIGDDSHGLFVQSVGGGGGSGGMAIAAAATTSGSVNVGVGGSSGAGGDAEFVSLTNLATGTISTFGDHAYGILAQSVGGGGGDGGAAIAGGIGSGTTANFGVGGSGSAGGDGRAVFVNNQGSIQTTGEVAHGIVAQSQGGGGGTGGFAIAGTISTSNQLDFTFGGKGGSAGNASTVNVTNSGNITTGDVDGSGKGSYGISAQSIGGGGGSGGFAGSFSVLLGGSGNAMSIGIGGDGSGGGAASTVTVDNSGQILTQAIGSVGLFAQSIGGGGGDGGFAMAFSLSPSQEKAAASLTVGGKGGSAGDGAVVDVTNRNSIQTIGDNSQGILAQSVGGGGGNGGFAASAALGTGNEAKSLSAAIGGSGGGGGDGNTVKVTNTASITTSGNDSAAIQAESIGKGGGNGGFSFAGSLAGTSGKSASLTIGGFGGGGGKGGEVDLFSTSASNTLTTFGDRSHGLFAQSIGGGGGNGGFAISGALGFGGNDPNKSSVSLAIGLGGEGGVGNTGGTVNVGTSVSHYIGSISTSGQESVGLLAQSIGGGGGNGGFAFAGTLNLNAGQKGPNGDYSIAVGGSGGFGNDGGVVNVFQDGNIITAGDNSYGIEAQSVGGGGGNGGASRAISLQLGSEQKGGGKENQSLALSIGGDGAKAGNGNAVNVIHNGNILTGGADAYGIFAQSVGGGGGTGGNAYQGFEGQFLLRKFDRSKFAKSVKFVLGGSGGSSGEGGAVFVSQSGTVTTTGIGSHAIFAQSVGGGGGAGGSGVLDLGLGLWSGGIGGDSGTSGNGHDVITNADGRINTFGDGAFGIFAQSVGGGGGAGGSVERGLNRYVNLNIGFGVAYGRGGGNGGDGGTVTVNSTATIYTEGAGSTGIMAQSVGGGGGVVGGTGNDFPILETLNFAGSVGGSGSGGIVTVNQTGNITTLGDAANGIFAQSAGGTNLGRDVTVNVNGSIVTSGLESNAIVAQSLGQGGNGNIAVNLNSSIGIVQGGLGTGAAVRFLDGRDNTLTNHSMLTTFRGLLGTSFVGTTGNDTVDNFGTYVGSVDAGTGVNAFNNRAGGVFGTGAFINLGDDSNSFFTNAGATTFGQFGALQTTSLTGNIGQSGNTARWLVDIGQIGTSDSLRATGRAEMGTSTGVVDLNELSVPTGTGAYTLMRAEQGGFAASAGNFKFGTLFGAMPLERTFEFKGTNTEAQLTLLPSVGIFHWSGANSSSWITPFVNGISNWTRDGAANYVYGTPGAGADLIFSATGTTTMGADFNINSIRFTGAGATLSHTLAAGNTLTIFGTGGRGVTIDAGSMATTLSPTIVLAGDQTWLNDGAGLFAVNGTSITGAHNLGVDGSGVTNIFSSIQIGGALTKSGSGLLILSGLNTYGGGTVVNGGTLLGDTTSLQGAFINNALVVFDQGFTGTFGSNMSGTGTLQKQGGGLLVLTGTNTYTGGTIVNGGTLMVNSNSLPGNVLNETSLIFNQTETGTFAGSMTGGGLFTKQGGGRLVLSGNSSVFGGTSIVTEGQLVVNGALGGKSLTMMPGTLLGGNGVVTATTLQGGSTLAPGNSIGALAVDGDLTFQAGAFYNVETESYGPSDWTFTSGELFTGGAVVNAQAGGSRRYRPINRYRILTAQSGIDGSFGGVTSNLSYLNPSLQYDPNNVFLTLRRNDVNFNDFGTKGNQVEVADVLNQLVAYATDDLADVVNNVYDLSGGDALSALTSMSGIIHQHVSRASLDVPRMFVGANMRRLGVVGDHGRSLMPNFGLAFNSQTASTANPIANQDYGLWITGMGGSTAYRGLPGDPGADGPSQGFVAGFDRAFGESLTFGISGGQSSPRVELEGSGDRSTADMNQFGFYGRFLRGRSRLDGVLTYSGYDNRTTRTVTDGFRAALLTSNYNARNLASQIEYGRSIGSSGGFVFEPQVGMQFGRVSFDGFDEQGDAVLALSVPERTVNSRRLVTGARVARPFSAGRTKMMAEGRASYAHDFSTIEGLPVQFQGDAFTAGFNMQPTAQLVNGAVLGAGFVGEMFGSFRFFADVQGEVSGPVKSWTGNVGLNKTW